MKMPKESESGCRGILISIWKRLRTFAQVLLFSTPLFFSTAYATYNSNIAGTVTNLATYPSGVLYFILSNQPGSNGSCTATYFELDPPSANPDDPVSDAAFARMYARLAQAYATGETITVGYDNAGNCARNGNIRVYRIG